MFAVFWIEIHKQIKMSHCREFDTGDMIAALKFADDLRQRQAAGEYIRHISMSSENTNSVGIPSAAIDYHWAEHKIAA
ncbi:hypothetical protein ACO0LC_05305 [Undibacterium sp. JH2W]|uniref:hypothetical protein n=1 Tax=Undibacterium sp. JH2W TaxID=3413037 RepID=UPI003BEFF655